MKTLSALLLLFALALPGYAQTAPPKKADPAAVRKGVHFPPNPAPPPVPAPQSPLMLSGQEMLVLTSDMIALIAVSPPGLVDVANDTTPLRIRGIFWGAGGKTETRSYPTNDNPGDKYVYIITATGTGAAELLIFDDGVLKRQPLIVNGGGPAPVPPVPPGPVPPPDLLTAILKAALAADGQPASVAGQLAALYRQVASVTVLDPTVKTYVDLFAAVHTKQDALIPEAKIPALRMAIGADLTRVLGTSLTAPIDRAAAAAEFNKLAQALEGVGR